MAGTPPAPPGYHLLLAGVMMAAAVFGVTVEMVALVAGLRTLSMKDWLRVYSAVTVLSSPSRSVPLIKPVICWLPYSAVLY